MATTRTSSAGKVSFGSWESEEREHPQGCSFFARSPARGDFAARKGCFCPCTVQGASQRGHSLSQKRMAPLEPQEKDFDWQSQARMAFVPPEGNCLRAALPRLELLYDLPLLLLSAAALESERKCSVITCYRWHNIAASAAKPPRQTIASLYKSKVGGNCVRLTNRRQSDSEDRSKPSRLDTKNSRHPIPQAAQLFELLACNANLSLGGSKGGYSLS